MAKEQIYPGNSDQFEVETMVNKEIYNYIMQYSKKHKLKMHDALREILSDYIDKNPIGKLLF